MYEIYRNLRGGTSRLRDEDTKGLVFLIILKYNSSLFVYGSKYLLI
jgi:hypothetical protein